MFAAVGLATIFDFSGADELAKNGIPSFGWNINADWNKPNLFGNAGALCLGCSGVDLPWMAKQLDKKTIGVLAYSVDDSKKCAEGVKKSFEEFPTAKVAFYTDSLSFGDVDFSVEVSKMKDAGVDFITTCMDTNGVLNIAKEARKQGLDAIQYLPNGYDQAFMKANGQFFEDSIVRVPFVPFETKPRPAGLDEYLTWMKKQGDTPERVHDLRLDQRRDARRGPEGRRTELHPGQGRRRAQQDEERHGRRHDPRDRLDHPAHRDPSADELRRARQGREQEVRPRLRPEGEGVRLLPGQGHAEHEADLPVAVRTRTSISRP